MVEIEQRALSALEQHALAGPQRAIHQKRRIGDVRGEPLGEAEMRLHDLLDVEWLQLVHALQPDVLLCGRELDLLPQNLRVEQVLDANPDAGGLVGIRGADPPPGRTDLQTAELALPGAIQRDVPGHDQVGVSGDEQKVSGLVPASLEIVELGDENARIDDAAGPDRAALGGDDPRRDLPDLVGLAGDDDRVAGVRTALVAADEIRLLGEQIDDLSLALVAPLRTDDDSRGHVRQSCTRRGASCPRSGPVEGVWGKTRSVLSA